MSKKNRAGTPAVSTETPAPEQAQAAETPEQVRKAKTHRRRVRAVRDAIIRLVMLMLVVYILFFHLVGLTVMPNTDMYPRIDNGDMVLFYRLEYNIRAQDIIVFEKPTSSLEQSYEQEEVMVTERVEKTWWRKALDWLGFKDPADPPMSTFICRVVAAPGDTVSITEDERLMVNGNTMIESNIFYSTPQYAGFVQYPLVLGEGEYFVLGDHRDGAADSRFFGAVRVDEILGTVITILRRNNL